MSSDGTFTADEKAVALELIDDALSSSDSDYWIRIATVSGSGSGTSTSTSTSTGSGNGSGRMPTTERQEPMVAGYICYGPTPMTASTFDLYWIVTHARARGRGVAKALIRAMEQDLSERGVTGIRVETSVKESHDAARRLYAALEYPIAAQFADFYAKGDDLIVYFKQFSSTLNSSTPSSSDSSSTA